MPGLATKTACKALVHINLILIKAMNEKGLVGLLMKRYKALEGVRKEKDGCEQGSSGESG